MRPAKLPRKLQILQHFCFGAPDLPDSGIIKKKGPEGGADFF